MLKKTLYAILLILASLDVTEGTVYAKTLLVFDEPLDAPLKQFRTAKDAFKTAHETNILPTRTGLDGLNLSGSGQFSKRTLEKALQSLSGPVWIIDLRKESHGFVNDLPISWYSEKNQSNQTDTNDSIQRKETLLIADLKRQDQVVVNTIIEKREGTIMAVEPHPVIVGTSQVESALAHDLKVNYLRLGVLDHHRPDDQTVDEFISFMKILPPEAWLHFHCRGGKGRTTTFMVLVDMLHNAKTVAMGDIVKRQAMIGGSDLFAIPDDADSKWKKQFAIERRDFIIKFYQYAQNGYPRMSWSRWNSK